MALQTRDSEEDKKYPHNTSIILPYWDRLEAAQLGLKSLEKYDIEKIVIDDGNREPFPDSRSEGNYKLIRLPLKDEPLSCIVPWNRGAEVSREILIISCIEVIHESPVIEEMVKELEKLGRKGYVLASAWCPEDNKFHCHSTVRIPTCPDGTGLSFCAAIYRDFFLEIGGFDEIYREGAGYEDRDFIWRLVDNGAIFKIRDDLQVIHPKYGASIRWEDKKFKRNQKIYIERRKKRMKQQEITFVCLKAGKLYNSAYVNRLYNMVRKNLEQDFKFVCITDDKKGIIDSIETIELPSDLETWWGKLYMFKRGLFREGSRVIFMDLDTLIVGNIDEIVRYDGKFGTLKDFYHPKRVGPAIISWEVGDFSYSVWDEWVSEGKPRNEMGDLWWLNNLDQGRFVKKIDLLQDFFPDEFVSYKVHCKPYPPKGTKVVCFHGIPKPSDFKEGWVKDVWI